MRVHGRQVVESRAVYRRNDASEIEILFLKLQGYLELDGLARFLNKNVRLTADEAGPQ